MNRRQTLRLIGGALIGSTGLANAEPAPADRGSFRMISGEVRVGGRPALEQTILKPGDTISTGPGATASFVIGKDAFQDAFQLRAETLVELADSNGTAAYRIERGGMLFSVAKDRVLRTAAGIFDIGSGAGYLEVKGGETYFCLCHGDGVLLPASAPGVRNAFLSDHHDRPVVVRAGKKPEQAMVTAQLRGHSDAEIAALDALAGRTTPFAVKG